MKKQASPIFIAVAVVLLSVLIISIYYNFLGGPSGKAQIASPYGVPTAEDFKAGPKARPSGRNSITGEALPPSAAPSLAPGGGVKRPIDDKGAAGSR